LFIRILIYIFQPNKDCDVSTYFAMDYYTFYCFILFLTSNYRDNDDFIYYFFYSQTRFQIIRWFNVVTIISIFQSCVNIGLVIFFFFVFYLIVFNMSKQKIYLIESVKNQITGSKLPSIKDC
jgi:hypothetical protein